MAWGVTSLTSMDAKRADRAMDVIVHRELILTLSIMRCGLQYGVLGRIYGCLHHSFRLPRGALRFPLKLEVLPGLRMLTFLRALLSCRLGPLEPGSGDITIPLKEE